MVYTYGQLAHLAQRVAAQLHARGLHPGDRVVIYANNSPQYIGALWGIRWAGMVAVPVNAKLHVNELMYILDHFEARVVLSDDGHAGPLRAGLTSRDHALARARSSTRSAWMMSPQLNLSSRQA